MAAVTVRADVADDTLTLVFEGRLDSSTAGRAWREALAALDRHPAPRLVVDASKVSYCDGAGIGLLFELKRRQPAVEIAGLDDDAKKLLDRFNPADFAERPRPRQELNVFEEVGEATADLLADIAKLIRTIGELTAALLGAALRPWRVRWRDVALVAEASGVNALPIVALLGFLIGLIIAFQSAIPLKQVGADVFVAHLVAISLVRELGPLMTALLLAGRTGAAFAAEIGTMKVNEEVDALTTMGLSPVSFLVVPRVIAGVATTPLLTVFSIGAGLVGGWVVFATLGFPMASYLTQVKSAVGWVDVAGGLAKSVVFGILIAGVGCLRGLQTKAGARSVGVSATRAVVSGIILIIVTDGLFAVLYHALGI
jgi:phospholipid/cholesterol/gamma-HCH transport system permease protein